MLFKKIRLFFLFFILSFIVLLFNYVYAFAPVPGKLFMTVVQPGGVKLKIFKTFPKKNYFTDNRLEIPVLKNKEGYYVLAVYKYVKSEKEKNGRHYYLIPTKIRADSPIAITKKINGKWHFISPKTNKKVPFDSKEVILPTWPKRGEGWESGGSNRLYFTGKFKPNGDPIYFPSYRTGQPFNQEIKKKYRPHFAGSIDIWFLIVPFLLLWKRCVADEKKYTCL